MLYMQHWGLQIVRSPSSNPHPYQTLIYYSCMYCYRMVLELFVHRPDCYHLTLSRMHNYFVCIFLLITLPGRIPDASGKAEIGFK